jgi:hypothetical protein
MKRNLGVRFAFAAVALGFALGASASAQTPSQAPDSAMAAVFAGESLPQAPFSGLIPAPTNKCGIFCDTSYLGTTATLSSSGSDCDSASNSLKLQLQSEAGGDCQDYSGFNQCQLTVHDTTTCTMTAPGTWQIQGYATFHCRADNC